MYTSGNQSAGNLLIGIVLAVVVSFAVYSIVIEKLRDRELSRNAGRMGLQGEERRGLPELNLAGTSLARTSKIWNERYGRRGGVDVIVFDCRIGEGKGSTRKTVIAARHAGDPFVTAFFESSKIQLSTERAGEWSILFSSGISLMPVSEIEAHLDAIGPVTS